MHLICITTYAIFWLHLLASVSPDRIHGSISALLDQVVAATDWLTLTGSTDTLIDIGQVHKIVHMDGNLPRVSGSHISAREMKESIELYL